MEAGRSGPRRCRERRRCGGTDWRRAQPSGTPDMARDGGAAGVLGLVLREPIAARVPLTSPQAPSAARSTREAGHFFTGKVVFLSTAHVPFTAPDFAFYWQVSCFIVPIC